MQRTTQIASLMAGAAMAFVLSSAPVLAADTGAGINTSIGKSTGNGKVGGTTSGTMQSNVGIATGSNPLPRSDAAADIDAKATPEPETLAAAVASQRALHKPVRKQMSSRASHRAARSADMSERQITDDLNARALTKARVPG